MAMAKLSLFLARAASVAVLIVFVLVLVFVVMVVAPFVPLLAVGTMEEAADRTGQEGQGWDEEEKSKTKLHGRLQR